MGKSGTGTNKPPDKPEGQGTQGQGAVAIDKPTVTVSKNGKRIDNPALCQAILDSFLPAGDYEIVTEVGGMFVVESKEVRGKVVVPKKG